VQLCRKAKSNLPAKPPIDGSYFLLNGFPRRICVLSDAGHDNLIEPVMNIARLVPDTSLSSPAICAPSNALNRAHIEARSEHARGIGRAECLKIELLGVQPCALRHRFAFYELWKGTHKQAAFELGIAEYTVQIHGGHIMRKMEADSLATLVKLTAKFTC
jgi:hypothetical protein